MEIRGTVEHEAGIARRARWAFVAALVLSGISRSAEAQTWTAQASGTGNSLQAVHFPGSNSLGYAAGASGVVLKTTNGTTWSALTSGTTEDLWDVFFVSTNTGWVVGKAGLIRKTTDGSTWTAQTSGIGVDLFGVFFPDASNGWAVGVSGTIRRTTNGGAGWSGQTSGTGNDLQAVVFISSTVGWAVGKSGTILKTTNGGSTWTAQTSGTGDDLWAVSFVGANTGWVVGNGGTIRQTTNGGSTWTAQTSGTTSRLMGVHFIDANNGYAVGDGGGVRKTVNGGTTWTGETSGTGNVLNDVHFPVDACIGYALGESGTIVKRTQPGGCVVYGVAVAPATATASRLPSNGTNYTVGFTVTNTGGGSDNFDLLTVGLPGTTISVVSITGAGVTQGGNPDSARLAALAAGSSTAVTVTYSIANVALGTTDTLRFTARSVGSPAQTASGRLEVTVVKPSLTVAKSVNPSGTQAPGAILTYTISLTNVGSEAAAGIVHVDSLPAAIDFAVGSVVTTLPPGVSATTTYSSDGGASWTYVPVSGGCGAPAGYDRCVNRIRWIFANPLGQVAPNNTGQLDFGSRIR